MAIGGATSSLPGVHEAQWRRRDRGRRGREHQRPPGHRTPSRPRTARGSGLVVKPLSTKHQSPGDVGHLPKKAPPTVQRVLFAISVTAPGPSPAVPGPGPKKPPIVDASTVLGDQRQPAAGHRLTLPRRSGSPRVSAPPPRVVR